MSVKILQNIFLAPSFKFPRCASYLPSHLATSRDQWHQKLLIINFKPFMDTSLSPRSIIKRVSIKSRWRSWIRWSRNKDWVLTCRSKPSFSCLVYFNVESQTACPNRDIFIATELKIESDKEGFNRTESVAFCLWVLTHLAGCSPCDISWPLCNYLICPDMADVTRQSLGTAISILTGDWGESIINMSKISQWQVWS